MSHPSLDNLSFDSQLHQSNQELDSAPDLALKRINSLYEEIMGIKDLNLNEIHIPSTLITETETNRNVKNQYLKTCCTTLQELCFKCERYLSKCSTCNQCGCENSNIVILKNQNYNKSPKRSPNDYINNDFQSPCKYTVPKPFSFYDKDNEWLKAREIKLSKMKEQLNNEIEKELKVRVHSKPVPKNTHLPLYNQMIQEKKSLKEVRKERCCEILSTTKPFNFQKKDEEHTKSASDLTKNKISNDFKAKPLPKHLFSKKVTERMKNRVEVRKMLVHERAKHILETSSSPFSQRSIPRSYSMVDINKKEMKKDYSNIKISDITKRLYVKKCNETLNAWSEKVSQVDTSCKKNPQDDLLNKHTSANHKKVVEDMLPFYYFPVRMSNATHLRDKQIREKIEARKENEEKTSPEKLRKQINKDMILKIRSVIPTSEREKEIGEKVKSYREWQEKRQEEYEKELKEIMSRVAEQSLLLERISKVSKTPPKNITSTNGKESEDASIKSDSEESEADDESDKSKSSGSESHSRESEENHQTDATESKSL